MHKPYFFGYGSLVNQQTHHYEQAQPARVRGWRRKWRHTNLRNVAYLTAYESEGHEIDGLIAAVPNGDWQALDLREHAYDRLQLQQDSISHDHPDDLDIHLYRTKPGNDAPPSTRHPILQSYLDTVLLGYRNVFGLEGMHHFIATTDGWDSPVRDDRKSPVYARAVSVKAKDRTIIDNALDDLAITRVAS